MCQKGRLSGVCWLQMSVQMSHLLFETSSSWQGRKRSSQGFKTALQKPVSDVTVAHLSAKVFVNVRGPTVQQSLSLIHNTHAHISNVKTILDICAGLYKLLLWNKCSNIPWRHQRPVRSLRANTNTIKEHSTNVHIVGYFSLFSFASVLVAGFKWPLSRVSVHNTELEECMSIFQQSDGL